MSDSGQPGDFNQRVLLAALGRIRRALERRAGSAQPSTAMDSDGGLDGLDPGDLEALAPPGSALHTLTSVFALSPFERDLLLLCAGVELDSAFPRLCAAAQGLARGEHATFALALSALSDPHWSALVPGGALRRFSLIHVGDGVNLTQAPLRIDEHVLHYLVGLPSLPEKLLQRLEWLPPAPDSLPDAASQLAQRLGSVLSAGAAAAAPLVQLCGDERVGTRTTATATACAALGVRPHRLLAADLASDGDRELLMRVWDRHALLTNSILYIDLDDEEDDTARALTTLIDRMLSVVIVSVREPLRFRRRPAARLDAPPAAAADQEHAWHVALGERAAALNGTIERVSSQFRLSVEAMRASAAQLAATTDPPAEALWSLCCAQSRARLDRLAQRIEACTDWDDLVLPTEQRQTLSEIAMHVRHQRIVYETWRFSAKSSRGQGVTALFAGLSGTGKTMAAEVLARTLRLDLYRVDLSQVVSKYIGETEKNLRRVFDGAEAGGALLLFDEADALFGKRSEVKDSHDRYANIEVGYLLQRMEAYRGLAILTTNMKDALDPAFLRRLRFVVQFPFPDAAQRAEIWRRIFPQATPTDGLDLRKLSRLHASGGQIRNIALNAAFYAADEGQPVRMQHLLRATRSEMAKNERTPTDAEVGAWT